MRYLAYTALVAIATFSAAQPTKPLVAIGPIDAAAQNISCEGWDRENCNEDLSIGFRAMLETAITKTGKMDVMERGQLDALLNEQAIGQMGLTDRAGPIGGLTGVDYYVYGTITNFGSAQKGLSTGGAAGSLGGMFGGRAGSVLGSVSTANIEVQMGVDLKVSAVETGRIVIADALKASVQSGSTFSIGGITQADASADPFADVQRVLASNISEAIVTASVPIKVIQVQRDGTLILNYGNVILAPGQQLIAFEVGESFVDPDTGEVLGSDEIEVGRVEITRAEARFSRAQIVGEPFDANGATLRRVVEMPEEKKGRWRR